jgi:IS4 transposase
MDRGYIKRQLFNAIVAKGSSYVCRMRDKIEYEVTSQRDLSEPDKQAGVLSDEVVVVKSSKSTEPIDHSVRIICVKCSPHTSRGRRSGRKLSSSAPNSDGILRILTNDLELPAELIAEIYAKRWVIELFFRMFKQLLGCKHLLSTKQEGVEIQIYSAIIACMLIMLYTGGSVTKRTFEMMSFYISGWASAKELESHIEKMSSKAS